MATNEGILCIVKTPAASKNQLLQAKEAVAHCIILGDETRISACHVGTRHALVEVDAANGELGRIVDETMVITICYCSQPCLHNPLHRDGLLVICGFMYVCTCMYLIFFSNRLFAERICPRYSHCYFIGEFYENNFVVDCVWPKNSYILRYMAWVERPIPVLIFTCLACEYYYWHLWTYLHVEMRYHFIVQVLLT